MELTLAENGSTLKIDPRLIRSMGIADAGTWVRWEVNSGSGGASMEVVTVTEPLAVIDRLIEKAQG
jgi:hypothetical protein